MKKDINVSTTFTSHLWLDRKILVTTNEGDILIAEASGDFKMVLPSSPGPQFKIKLITSRKSDGFIIASQDGRFKSYQATDKKECPYVL